MRGKRGNPGLQGRLIHSSTDAYILALETINRLSVRYRVEVFAYLICNAWELLLKAKILQDTRNKENIYYPKEKDRPRRSRSLRDCVQRVFLNENDPIRRNIERIADLRDAAVHLVIGDVPNDALLLFQAAVLNYHSRLAEWFAISLSARVPVGMMVIAYDFSPAQFDLSNARLRRQLGRDAADYLMKFQQEVRQEFAALGKPAEFSIDINYKLALTQKPNDADILLTKGGDGSPTRIIETPKDPSKTHPYRCKEVVAQVTTALNGRCSFNAHDVTSIVKVHDITKRPEFYYQGSIAGSPKQYSAAFIEWVLKHYENDNNYFQKTREKASRCNKM